MFFSAVLAGLGAGLTLIVAIGAQNAFVLRQGLRGEHVFPVVAVCALSDIGLISAGTAGLEWLAGFAAWTLPVMTWGGVAFLVAYGALSLRRAWRGGSLVEAGGTKRGLGPVLATTLALTWLNPHVYLDTVLLLGSLAQAHAPHQWWFAIGAMAGSCLWFPALGYGARLLRPVFASPTAWRVLDIAIALVMWGIAASLVWRVG
ncbi:MAG: LysE/ArgO family amino acid transporter [Propionibacteriaceae bacterium]|jgi:L-lysine exporter family protein LysE/ArgO|nr:LysE/ArgO family amino acid transporter [Propionibacteriaceae bacterium]